MSARTYQDHLQDHGAQVAAAVERARAGCPNCGSRRPPVGGATGAAAHCADCDWPLRDPVPDAPFCSVCRRRHGPERIHACE
jgi:hypothetical protein